MPTPANAINQTQTGIVKFDGTSSFTATSLTPYCVLAGSTSNNITSIGPGNAGQVYQAQGVAANPAYTTATYPSTASSAGKLMLTDGTNWVASTPSYPTSASTSGKIVFSDGTNFVNSTPTFPNASATNRKIIVSDGTNWVASTETYATPGTSGNLLTSDGTNWTSAAAQTEISLTHVTTTITNAQLKAGTAVSLVAAAGAGTVIYVTSAAFKLNYGGSNAFTNSPTCRLSYDTGSSGTFITSTLLLTSTTNRYSLPSINSAVNLAFAASAIENTAVYWSMSAALTGNAANNNTITVDLYYYVLTL